MTNEADKPSVEGLTLAALTKAERALWVLREHNHLYFGHDHSTVAEAQAAWLLVRERLASAAAPAAQPATPLREVPNDADILQVAEPDSSYVVSPVPTKMAPPATAKAGA